MGKDHDTRQESAIDPREFEAMVRREMGSGDGSFDFTIESIARGELRMRLKFDERQLRPGRTIAGPVMFTLADTALYAAVLSVVGMVPMAVTTDMTLHFLRRPKAVDMIADCKLLRSGSRLMVGDVLLYSDGDEEPVAHATGTYAVPPSPGSRSHAKEP